MPSGLTKRLSGNGVPTQIGENLRLHTVEVCDFKSYAGEHIIGPFDNFTCIIGPNGAGKSNVVDALSFAFGLTLESVRAESAKDFVHRGKSRDKSRIPFVKVSLINGEDQVLEFKREIKDDGKTVEFINDKKSKFRDYIENVKSCGIDPDARNFLIQQMEIQSIINKSDQDLASFFERMSGSLQLKAEYINAFKKRNQAEEAHAQEAEIRQSINRKKTSLKEQRKEAQQYESLREKESELHRLRIVARAVVQNNELERLCNELEDCLQKAEAEDAAVEEMQEEAAAMKKRRAALQKEFKLQEKAVEKMEKEVAKATERRTKANATRKVALKSKAGVEKEISRALAKKKEVAEKIKRLSAEVEGLQRRVEESEAAKLGNISADDLKEFNALQSEMRRQSKSLTSQKGELQQSLESISGELEEVKERQTQNFHRTEILQQQLEELGDEATSARLEKELLARKAALVKKVAALEKEERQQSAAVDALSAKKSAANASLQQVEARVSKKEANSKALMAIQAMQKEFDSRNVIGRLVDLCQPKDRRYTIAVTVALVKYMDSVVVTNTHTAEECIKLLTNRKMHRMEFIPIHDIKSRNDPDLSRTRGVRVQLLRDVIDVTSASAGKAVDFVTHNVVLVESKEDALKLKDPGFKVITLDGTVFERNGMMSGGTDSSQLSKADRWSEAETRSQLRSAEDRFQEELLAWDKAVERRTGIKEDLRVAKEDLKKLDGEHREAKKQKDKTLVHRKNLESELKACIKLSKDRLQAQIFEYDGKLANFHAQLLEVDRQLQGLLHKQLQPFLDKHGLSHEQAEELAKGVQDASKERAAMKSLLSNTQKQLERELKLNAKLDEEMQLSSEKAKEAISEVSECEVIISQAQDSLAQLQQGLGQAKSRSSDLRKEMQEADAKYGEAMQAYKKAQHHTSVLQQEKLRAETKVSDQKESLQEIIAEAEARNFHVLSEHGQILAQELPIQIRRSSDTNKLMEFLEQLDKDLKDVSGKLSQMQPNLKYREHMDSVEVELSQQKKAFDRTLASSRQAVEAFESVKQQRVEKFRTFFDKVKVELREIYHELTAQGNTIGGDATLSEDNTAEPYAGGIRFDVIPPSKKYRPLKDHAGGEQAIASLSLVFAVYAVRPAPFLVLDEVDANLDRLHLRHAVEFVSSRTGNGMQVVAVSHREHFYQHSQLLVGVCRNIPLETSTSLSLDLTRYRRSVPHAIEA